MKVKIIIACTLFALVLPSKAFCQWKYSNDKDEITGTEQKFALLACESLDGQGKYVKPVILGVSYDNSGVKSIVLSTTEMVKNGFIDVWDGRYKDGFRLDIKFDGEKPEKITVDKLEGFKGYSLKRSLIKKIMKYKEMKVKIFYDSEQNGIETVTFNHLNEFDINQ